MIIASIIHLICSALVGLLYGAALPMFPRRPVLFGGVIAPILWSALIHSMLEALDPALKQRINWLWFVISQIGFGIVAGIVVSRQERIPTWQYLFVGSAALMCFMLQVVTGILLALICVKRPLQVAPHRVADTSPNGAEAEVL